MFIVTLLFLGILWIGAGFLITYTQAKERKILFEFKWNPILTWPEIFKK
jgi:hypothetical protein